ncbi:MAG TPA: CRTAC1 family protein [Candidatus Polarisedimenticolia bacterium]|nr:CRTAC1 family protein [Candidatus Polarisedimenticolia bacterium]
MPLCVCASGPTASLRPCPGALHLLRPVALVVCVLAGSFLATLLFAAPPSRAAAPPPDGVHLADVTRDAGLTFTHSFGDTRFSNLVEAVGGGVVWLDYDNDGWIDVYFVTGKYTPGVSEGARPPGDPQNRLYRNRGDGTFEDVTGSAGVGCAGCFSIGAAAADYDNDGWTDLYVTNDGANVLYRTLGNGRFADVTARAGVGDPGCSVAAVWFDFDRDGRLDLYVGNYIEFDPKYVRFYPPDGFPGPLAYPPQPDTLYRNRGDGTFENVTARVGLTKKGRAMSVAAADYDGDGYDDLYVTNDATENFLYHNEAGRALRDAAPEAGVAYNGMGDQTSSMAVDFGDFDGDGRIDIFVSDNSLSSLYRNLGDGTFEDIGPEAGIARTSAQFVGWGAFFFDLDNDGDLDIFKANSDLSRLFGQEDQVFENQGGGRFRDISRSLGPYFREARMGRGAAFADYDNDGDPDIAINNLGSPAVLLRNEGGNHGHCLVLRLVGRASNRDGIGARVRVTAAGRVRMTEKRSSGGYLSQNDPRLFFGLGDSRTAQRVEVAWPSGRTQVIENVPTGKTVVIEEPAR